MTPALATIALILLAAAGYAALCAASPFGPCRKCRGMGFKVRTDRKGRPHRGRDCRRCRATGRRIRVGRHLFNLYQHTRRAAR